MAQPKVITQDLPPAKNVTGPENGGIHGAWRSGKDVGGVWDNARFGRIDPKQWVQSKAFDAYVREETNDRRIEVPVWTLPAIPVQQLIGGGAWTPAGKTEANAKGMSTPLLYQSSMAVDSDGGGGEYQKYHDTEGQAVLSLSYAPAPDAPPNAPAVYPDPTVIPYVVLPQKFYRTHSQVQLGDVVAVLFNPGHSVPDGKGGKKTVFAPEDGRVAYGIYADQGGDYRNAKGHKKTQIGESSMLLAQQVGVHPSPVDGGTPNGVTYVVFPGSAFNKPGTGLPTNVTAQMIAERGAKLFAAAGGAPGPLPSPTFDTSWYTPPPAR